MIKAIKDKVVGVLLVREKTAGGIILPGNGVDPQAYCKVTSVGEEVQTVKEGDIVVCHIRGGMDAVFEKEITKVLKEEEIYGILTHEPTIECLKEIVLQQESKEESRIVKV
jgi:co-chaperonin GroES (HSP10)